MSGPVRFCPDCGRLGLADFRFCPYCGRSLDGEEGLEAALEEPFSRLEGQALASGLGGGGPFSDLDGRLRTLEADLELFLEGLGEGPRQGRG